MATRFFVTKFRIILSRMWGFSSRVVCIFFLFTRIKITKVVTILERDMIIDNYNKISIIQQVKQYNK